MAGPLLICNAIPFEGHFGPVFTIASHLKDSGYDVVFLAEQTFGERIEAAGIEHFEIHPEPLDDFARAMMTTAALAPSYERDCLLLKEFLAGCFTLRFKAIHHALGEVKSKYPDRDVVIMEDIYSIMCMAYSCGHDLPVGFDKPPRTVGIGINPMLLESQDGVPPFVCLLPDSSEPARARNKVLNKLYRSGPMKPVLETWRQVLEDNGCSNPPADLRVWNSAYEAYDVAFQLCPPALEYDLSDRPTNVRFAGVLPRRLDYSHFQYPEWWSDVLDTSRVVFVSQGTVHLNYNDLIIPALKVLESFENILVVVALGQEGAKLPESVSIPANARVVDYFRYDLILEHASAFVTNGGYGAFTHGARNGCPMVLAGDEADKQEVALRAEYAGLGVNLRTQKPTGKQIRDGVEQILGDVKYRTRAEQIADECRALNPFAVIKDWLATTGSHFDRAMDRTGTLVRGSSFVQANI